MAKRRKKASRCGSIWVQLAVLLGVFILCLVLLGKLWAEDPDSTEDTATGIQTTEAAVQPTDTAVAMATDTTQATPPEATPSAQLPVDDVTLEVFMQQHDLTEADYTEKLLLNYQVYPEMREFIMNYPLEKDKFHAVDLRGYDLTAGVPLFLQWDPMWGYRAYGKNICGVSGCGPVSLSMVACYLTGSTMYDPTYIMQMAEENGYVGKNGGTNWTLFQRGAELLGLAVEELPLYEGIVKQRLEAGAPIVANVGNGDFTAFDGHYIVLVGWEDGMIRVNDPNSRINSEKLWPYAQLEKQIKNLWAFTLADNPS